jgi:hypothetical protein
MWMTDGRVTTEMPKHLFFGQLLQLLPQLSLIYPASHSGLQRVHVRPLLDLVRLDISIIYHCTVVSHNSQKLFYT